MFEGSDEAAVRGEVCSKPGVGGATGCQAVRENDRGEWWRGGEGWSISCGRHSGVTWWIEKLEGWIAIHPFTYQPGEDAAEAREERR